MRLRHAWYRRKPYPHFDSPLPLHAAEALVTDPARVAKHAFFPFIGYTLATPRVETDPDRRGRVRSNPKLRPIAYPCHRDGYIFSYYKYLLSKEYESVLRRLGISESVLAFRSLPGGNNVTYALEIFDHIANEPHLDIITTDVSGYFDNIDHELLKQSWGTLIGAERLPPDHYNVYRGITNYSYIRKHQLFNALRRSPKTKRGGSSRLCTARFFRHRIVGRGLIKKPSPNSKGIPQGSSISPFLSNLFLLDVDLALSRFAEVQGGLYRRYCDDIMLLLPAGHCASALGKIIALLKSRKLEINRKKTKVFSNTAGRHNFIGDTPVSYLGLSFDGHSVTIRPSSIHRYHRKLRRALRRAPILREEETAARERTDGKEAPLRVQAIMNRYSELDVRGKKAIRFENSKRFSGNFIRYLDRAAEATGSKSIAAQRRRLLSMLRRRIRDAK